MLALTLGYMVFLPLREVWGSVSDTRSTAKAYSEALEDAVSQGISGDELRQRADELISEGAFQSYTQKYSTTPMGDFIAMLKASDTMRYAERNFEADRKDLDDTYDKLVTARKQLQGKQYERMLVSLNLPEESEETFAFLDRFAHGAVVVVEAAVEANLVLLAGLLDDIEDFLDLIHIMVDRLLAENVLASLQSLHGKLGVLIC